jgi:glycosyltransferase involved in cell wall biosynthesis
MTLPIAPGLLPVVESTRPTCYHLGPQRRCCDSLFICKETPDTGCTLVTDIDGARNCSKCELYYDIRWDVSIVIPCHNYNEYLIDCLDSIEASNVKPARVVVVDDASDIPVETPAGYSFNIEVIRIDARDQSLACRAGFRLVNTKYVAFVDADDKISSKYVSAAIRRMEADPNAAAAFPYLVSFGDTNGVIMHNTDQAPDVVRLEDIERRNWCSAGTVFRSEVLRQTLALETDRSPGCGTNDWITIRAVLRAGPWHAVAANEPLHYRIHKGQMHTSESFKTYELSACLEKEVVTIIVAFSGRWHYWPQINNWIQTQNWPIEQTRLMILNNTHKPLMASMLGLHNWPGSLQIERVDVGVPGLADLERRNAPDTGRRVEAAVAGLYNKAVKLAGTEWLLFIEDDTQPILPDTIKRLMMQTYPNVAAVSGLYEHRYEPKAVAFDSFDPLVLSNMTGPEVSEVYGSGFGCLLIRKSVLSKIGLSGDSVTDRFYDVNVGRRVTSSGWRWLLNRAVPCNHLCKEQTNVG